MIQRGCPTVAFAANRHFGPKLSRATARLKSIHNWVILVNLEQDRLLVTKDLWLPGPKACLMPFLPLMQVRSHAIFKSY